MHPGTTDKWDGNWLLSPIEVSVDGFAGVIPNAGLRSDELQGLRRDLEALNETLIGTASLHSMEEWLSLTIEGDGLGHIKVTGEVSNHPGSSGNRLHFTLGLDQTFLPTIIESLTAIETMYEVFTSDD